MVGEKNCEKTNDEGFLLQWKNWSDIYIDDIIDGGDLFQFCCSELGALLIIETNDVGAGLLFCLLCIILITCMLGGGGNWGERERDCLFSMRYC